MSRPGSGKKPGGNSLKVRVKTGKGRTPSQKIWLERQLNDPYVHEARKLGYRSRAAFKLIEIDDRFRLIKKGSRVIDLGAAPGGWVQVALDRGAAAVAGVDLLMIEPIPGATLIQADFTHPGVDQQLIDAIGGRPDLVLSDMAHNTVGHRKTDHLKIIALIEIAADTEQRYGDSVSAEDKKELIRALEDKMLSAAGDLDFEKAARYRDELFQLQGKAPLEKEQPQPLHRRRSTRHPKVK